MLSEFDYMFIMYSAASLYAFWSNYVMGIMLEKFIVLPWNSTWPLTQEWILVPVRKLRTPENDPSMETRKMGTSRDRTSAPVSTRTPALTICSYSIAYLASKVNIDTASRPCYVLHTYTVTQQDSYQNVTPLLSVWPI